MNDLVIDAEKFVLNLLNTKLDPSFLYHSISHTQRVVEKTQEICIAQEINEEDQQIAVLAALFHDTGYTETIENHEEKGVAIATAYLKSQKVPKDLITKVSDLIIATKITNAPQNDLEKIIRDADCSHIGSKNFIDLTEVLREEWELTKDRSLTEQEWLKENIEFIKTHKFHSEFALKNWEKQKEKNLAQLLKTQKKIKQESSKLKHKKEELAFKKNKIVLPERGIETMFRVALRNHITLSDIADTKANILLSVNAIIISLALSNLLPKLDNPTNQYLIYPFIVFILFTTASIVLSVLATRPNITKGKFTKQDVADKKVNLLFFGNFHQMKLEDFEWAMDEMMKDRDYLYGSLTKDLYFLGLVLNRKYNLLRLTYTVFMTGIIVSVIAFAVAFKLQGFMS